MSIDPANILPFALGDRWIVTVESDQHFVKVRHRTRWFAVARRIGHKERRHWCASRSDALVIAEWQREAFESLAELERFKAMYNQLPVARQADVDAYLETLARQE